MSAAVATLPTRNAVDKAFDRYAALVREQNVNRELLTDIDHNIKIARAWSNWRDLFLAWDRRCK